MHVYLMSHACGLSACKTTPEYGDERQTVKRISLRRERRGSGRHRITIWDGVIELRDDLGVTGVIPLTDDDIPSPGSWRAVADFIRKRGDVVFF